MSRRHERRHLSSIIYLVLAISMLGLLMFPLAAAPVTYSEDFTGFTLDVPPVGWTIGPLGVVVVCDSTNSSIPTCSVSPPVSFPILVGQDPIAEGATATATSPSFTCDDTCILDFEFITRFDAPSNYVEGGAVNWGISTGARHATFDLQGTVTNKDVFICTVASEVFSCTDTGTTVTSNVYHTYQMLHDNIAGTVEFRVDSVLVGTRNIDSVSLTEIEIQGEPAIGTGAEWGIDDIVVTATSQGGGGGDPPDPGDPDDPTISVEPDFEWEPIDPGDDPCSDATRTLRYTDTTVSEASALLYIWDFGDGTGTQVLSTPSVVHAYAEVGTYTVEHAVTFVDGSITRTSALVEVGFCSVSFLTEFAPNIAIGIIALAGVLWMVFVATRRPRHLIFALIATGAGAATWAFTGFSGLATIAAGITTAVVALAAVLWAAFFVMRRRLLVYALIATMAAIMAWILA